MIQDIININSSAELNGDYSIWFTLDEETTTQDFSVFLKIDDEDFQEVISNESRKDITINGSGLTRGIHQAVVKIVDNEDEGLSINPLIKTEYVSKPLILKVKETPSIANIKTISTDSNGNYSISFDILGDKNFLHSVELKLDNGIYTEILKSQSLGSKTHKGKSTMGTHKLYLKVDDGYDNSEVEYDLNIVNNIPTLSHVIAYNENSSGSYTIAYTSSDIETSTLSAQLKVDNGSFQTITVNKNDKMYTYNGTSSLGTHRYTLRVSDGITTVDSKEFEITTFASSSSIKEQLKQAKYFYDKRLLDLNKTIESITNDKLFDHETEYPILELAKENYAIAKSEFTKAQQKAIDYVGSNRVDESKKALEGDIKDVSDALGGLEETMKGVFKDGVLSDNEKNSIRQSMQLVTKEKLDIDAKYNETYNNEDLIGSSKDNLKTKYDDFILKHNALVFAVDEMLNKEGIIDNEDKAKIDTAFDNWRGSISEYSKAHLRAIDAIAGKKAQDEAGKIDEKWADIVLDPDHGIVSSVGKLETIIDGVNDKVDNIQIGDRNLLLNSGEYVENSDYFIKSYQLAEGHDLKDGMVCTIAIKGELYVEKAHWGIYNSGPATDMTFVTHSDRDSDGVYKKTFTWKSNEKNNSINIYTMHESFVGKSSIQWIKLVKGNNTSNDWIPAIEDINIKFSEQENSFNEVIGGVNDTIDKVKEENTKTTNDIIANALLDYVTTGDYNKAYQELSTKLSQTSERFDFTFNQFKVDIEAGLDGVEATTSELIKYISFDNGDIILGNTDSRFRLKITNEKIQFLDNETEVAYISNQQLYITSARITDWLQIGEFKFIPRSNGNLSFTWVGK